MSLSAFWYDELAGEKSWTSLWSGYIRCGNCLGIRTTKGLCPSCNSPISEPNPVKIWMANGSEEIVPTAFMGAEGRYEDWVYLKMLEREWLRPLVDEDKFLSVAETNRPSARAIVILVFWTYFETRIERLFKDAMRDLPERIVKDLLKRHESISSRLEQLYKIMFSSTYEADLIDLGFDHVAGLLTRVRTKRNQFMHGHPEAIDDTLVRDLVICLKDEHESWISVFNRRAARKLN